MDLSVSCSADSATYELFSAFVNLLLRGGNDKPNHIDI